MPNVTTPPACFPPTIRTWHQADLTCYLCGASAGTIASDHQPFPMSAQYRVPSDTTGALVADRHQLGCPRCNGGVYLDDLRVVRERVETFEFKNAPPRRGRPPKRLVEQRSRRHAANGSRAA